MNFKDWLKQNGMTVKAAAQRLGVCKEHLSSVINGKRTSPFMVECIGTLTSHQVDLSSFKIVPPKRDRYAFIRGL